MNLRSKIHLEAQKAAAEQRLAARVALLEARGLDAAAVQREPKVRQARAAVRQTARRLVTIEELERRNAENARATAAKAAAGKAAGGAPPAAEAAPDRPRKKSKKGE